MVHQKIPKKKEKRLWVERQINKVWEEHGEMMKNLSTYGVKDPARVSPNMNKFLLIFVLGKKYFLQIKPTISSIN